MIAARDVLRTDADTVYDPTQLNTSFAYHMTTPEKTALTSGIKVWTPT